MNDNDLTQMRQLLKDFHQVDQKAFWKDFVINVIFSWPLFIYTCFYPNPFTFIVSTYFLYRGTMLIHEVSHLSKKIPGYRLAYDLFFGWPNNYPAYFFSTHLFHHGKHTYGTKRDPEYKYIPKYNLSTLLRPLLASLILPFFQVIRMGILPFVLLFLNKEKKLFVYRKLSTLVFTMEYERPIRDENKAISEMMKNDLICAFYKIGFLALIVFEVLPFSFLPLLYAAIVLASLLNMYRALFNHLYSNEKGEPLSWESHLLDTVTIEGGFLTSLIFVNGLNYHSLHHLFPDLPYLNLARAHEYLLEKLPSEHLYRKSLYPNIWKVAALTITSDRKNKMATSEVLN